MTEHIHDSAAPERGSHTPVKLNNALTGLLGLATTAARIVGAVFALILVIYIVLFVFEASPDNPITEFFANVSGGLTLWFANGTPGEPGFEGLFMPGNVKIAVLIDYGLAAIFWLVAAAVAVRILQAVTPKRR